MQLTLHRTLRRFFARRRFLIATPILMLALLFSETAYVQTGKKPISQRGLVDAVKINGLSTAELVQIIQRRGVDFEMSSAVEADLRAVGARSEVIEAARANYRPPVTTTATSTTASAAPLPARPSPGGGNSSGPPVPAGPPLSKNEVVMMLQGGASAARVEQFVEARGVTFSVTPDTAREIAAAGGTRSLLGAISEKSPPEVAATSSPFAAPTEARNTGPDYDDFVDRIQSAMSAGDWSSTIRHSQEAVQFDPSQPVAYSYLGQAMLYGRGDLVAAEQSMRAAIERGGSARFIVYHACAGEFTRVCVGSFFVTKTGVSYKANDGVDTFETEDSNIKEADTNAWVGIQYGAFNIKPKAKVIGRGNFNFAPFSKSRAESQLIIRLIKGY